MQKVIYKDIYEDLKQRINANSFDQGRLPSERQLATEYRVTRITLRKALKVLYSEGLIVRLGAKGTFASPQKPFSAITSALKIAYFQVNKASGPLGVYHGTIMSSIEKFLRQNQSSMLFYNIDSASEVERLLSSKEQFKDLDAIIVAGGATPLILKKIKRFQRPILLIGRLTYADPVEASVDQVMDDPGGYTQKAIYYLLKQNCKRIAFVASTPYQWSMLAQQRYMKLLEENELEYNEDLIIQCGYSKIREAFDLSKKITLLNPDGIFVYTDHIARGLYDGFTSNGIIPGKDIKWISIGHTGDSVEHLNLPRAVINPVHISEAAMELLSERLAKPTAKIMKEVIPHRLKNVNQ